jgi:hypothetical protein
MAVPLALAGCTDPVVIARAPVAHPVGPVVHVVTDTPAGAPETVAVHGLEKEVALRERTSGSSFGSRSAGEGTTSTQLVREEVSVPRFVCVAPCDQTVLAKPDQELVVGGDGLTLSNPFQIDPGAANVTLRVRRGSVAMRDGSKALMGVGVGSTIFGLVMMPFAFSGGSVGLKAGAGTALALGGTGIVVGTILDVVSPTRVDVIPGGVAF